MPVWLYSRYVRIKTATLIIKSILTTGVNRNMRLFIEKVSYFFKLQNNKGKSSVGSIVWIFAGKELVYEGTHFEAAELLPPFDCGTAGQGTGHIFTFAQGSAMAIFCLNCSIRPSNRCFFVCAGQVGRHAIYNHALLAKGRHIEAQVADLLHQLVTREKSHGLSSIFCGKRNCWEAPLFFQG